MYALSSACTRSRSGEATAIDDALRPLLDRYVRAWESADVAGLVTLLKEDATFSMPPVPTWYLGRETIGAAIGSSIFASEAQDRWHLRSTRANGQPAFAVYQRDDTGLYRIFGIQVLTFAGDYISAATTFIDPALFPHFGLPLEVSR